ncbi:hypothetical protein D3C74_376990 [compost metagenome]
MTSVATEVSAGSGTTELARTVKTATSVETSHEVSHEPAKTRLWPTALPSSALTAAASITRPAPSSYARRAAASLLGNVAESSTTSAFARRTAVASVCETTAVRCSAPGLREVGSSAWRTVSTP